MIYYIYSIDPTADILKPGEENAVQALAMTHHLANLISPATF